LAEWQGTLTYLNYSSPQTFTLAVAARGEMTRPDQLLLRFDYQEPNQSHVYGTDTLTLAAGGTRLRWDDVDYTVQAKQWLPGQTLHLVLEAQGRDNDRAATIRKTLTLSPRQFTLRKEVRYAAADAFFQRNQFQLAR
jgi:hypothetical protein